jgi:ketosteroid isomerase-like protein
VSQAVAAHQIERVEQAFAQTVGQIGIGRGFRKYAAPDAVMFLPDPAPAGPYLQTAQAPGELVWRPQFIGVAPSSDLAFSLGPSLYRTAGKAEGGFYMTIWKRGADGGWQFTLDRDAAMPAAAFDRPPRPLVVLAADPAAKPDQAQGLREADAGLDMDLSRDNPMAFASRLEDQAVVVRSNRPVAWGRRKALKLLSETPSVMDARLIAGGLSIDGVLGYTYGKARWMAATGPQQGYYVRVWRNTGQGWRLLVDHLAERWNSGARTLPEQAQHPAAGAAAGGRGALAGR